MPIFIGPSTRVIYQGLPDEGGQLTVHQCLAYGSDIVAWVWAGMGGQEVLGLPVFDTVEEARKRTDATVSVVFDPPNRVGDALLEAEDSGITLIICCTRNVPAHDLVEIKRTLRNNRKCHLLGPASCGVLSPDQCKVGTMPGYIFSPGSVGVISTEDTVAYEAVWQMTKDSIGQSTFVGVGNDPITGTSIADVVAEFNKDVQTDRILVLAKTAERALEGARMTSKPVLIYVPGQTLAPTPKEVPGHVRLIPSLSQISGFLKKTDIVG